MTKHLTHWIGGKPWDGEAGRHGDIYDPATGQVSGQVDFAAPAEVDAAVAAAKDALLHWRRISLAKRASVLFEFRNLVKANTKNLAQLITEEHGKVSSDAAGEVARGLEVVEFACGIPHLLKGGFSENVSTGVDAYSIRQPLGVAAGTTAVVTRVTATSPAGKSWRTRGRSTSSQVRSTTRRESYASRKGSA